MNDVALAPIDAAPAVSPPTGPLVPPRLSLSVGVTGHRLDRLGETNLAAIAAAAAAVLAAIAHAGGSAGAASLRLVSGLAEGADSIVADAALAQGWTLDVVLPFVRDDYAADFPAGEARAAHRRRLAAAHAVFELEGDRAAAGGDGAAYERAGRVVLAQSDILIAVWDGAPVRGRGGAAQIVAEAVLHCIPVIHLDATGVRPAQLLWDGLEEHDIGQQTVDTVARGDLARLPGLVRRLLDPPANSDDRAMMRRFERAPRGRGTLGIAYPLLLAVMGVRRFRRSDFGVPVAADALPPVLALCAGGSDPATAFDARLRDVLAPRFARADAAAAHVAQLFRSGYVANFSLAAFAVVLSLLGLAIPAVLKPVLILLELAAIALILIVTRVGNRTGWHRRWLDNRQLAERLRCLAVTAQLGELDLRSGLDQHPNWVSWYARATAREIGLPAARVDRAYLVRVRTSLTTLIDGQIAYFSAEAHRMHRLEHRLHRLGTALFATTALICVGVLVFKVAGTMALTPGLDRIASPLLIAATIGSAALPAIGAAIYGIRMQGDFAGVAERSAALSHHLAVLRRVIDADDGGFDTLRRRAARATDLLTEDLANWLQTYHARPLSLPG